MASLRHGRRGAYLLVENGISPIFAHFFTPLVDIHNEEQWIDWVDTLSDQNYLVIDDFISDEELKSFNQFLKKELNQDAFDKAGIGTHDQFQVDKKIRGDYIRWLNKDDSEVASYFERLEVIIQNLNRYCYLSLSGSEIHLAHYPVGTYYKRHLDQFQQRNNRLISVILYLNEDWKSEDGGELKVFLEDGDKTIAPIGKRLVLMRSNLVEHEVMMTNKNRYSITGWLLYQPVGLGFL